MEVHSSPVVVCLSLNSCTDKGGRVPWRSLNFLLHWRNGFYTYFAPQLLHFEINFLRGNNNTNIAIGLQLQQSNLISLHKMKLIKNFSSIFSENGGAGEEGEH